jgi:hypothetical protein
LLFYGAVADAATLAANAAPAHPALTEAHGQDAGDVQRVAAAAVLDLMAA